MAQEHKLTKKEKKELRKLEWNEKVNKEKSNSLFKKIALWGGSIVIILGSIYGLFLLVNSPSSDTPSLTASPVNDKDITTGNKNAKVVLTEYADFQCPACASYHPVVRQLLKDYEDKIYFVYRFFPLTQIHRNAVSSARAAYSASLQVKFWEYHDYLFENQKIWATVSNPEDEFASYAKKLGLNEAKFREDFNSDAVKKFVEDETNEGLGAGVNSTPTFFINGKQIQPPADYEGFKTVIDNELNKK